MSVASATGLLIVSDEAIFQQLQKEKSRVPTFVKFKQAKIPDELETSAV